MTQQIEKERIDSTKEQTGVVIGVMLGLAENGAPLVAFPGDGAGQVRARSTVALKSSDIGCQVALMFEDADWKKPLVIGRILVPGGEERPVSKTVAAEVDKERLTLTADREIVFKCGKASITLTRAGKIILKGTYVLSRSSGVNKIRGGSVQIN